MSSLKKALFLAVVLITFLVSVNTTQAATSWSDVANDIEGFLDQSLATYEKGDAQASKDLVNQAYFGPFEKEGMERAIRSYISSQRSYEHEAKFALIKKLINSGAPATEVDKVIDELREMLRADAARLDGSDTGSTGQFLSSFLIIVREGFEAILIIGAISAYLIKTGNKKRLGTIYRSTVAAIVASAATAILLQYVFKISGAGQEVLEGLTMLLAVAVLFSVSYWMISKVEAEKWRKYIEGKVQSSLSTGSSAALWVAVFLAVYREGAETVLFYQALLTGSPESLGSIVLGFVLGCVVLAVIFIIVRLGSVKIPLKPFFVATSSLMYYLAFVFAGKGVRELQEAGWVGSSTVPGVPVLDFLGVYPTWETLAPQILLLTVAVFSLVYHLTRGRGTDRHRTRAV
ncbi:MAG: FTR1 family iron permease [Bacillota bacterium]